MEAGESARPRRDSPRPPGLSRGPGRLGTTTGPREPIERGAARTGETRFPPSPGTAAARRPVEPTFPDPGDGPIRLIDGPDGPVPAALLERDPIGSDRRATGSGSGSTGRRSRGSRSPDGLRAGRAGGGAGRGGSRADPGVAGGTIGGLSARRPRHRGRPRPARPGPAGAGDSLRAGRAGRGASARSGASGRCWPRATSGSPWWPRSGPGD